MFMSLLAKAQKTENLYLISGHPYSGTDEEFETFLWKYNKEVLDTIKVLSNEEDFLVNVKIYPDQKMAVIYKISSIRNRHIDRNNRFEILTFGDSIRSMETRLENQGRLITYNLLPNSDDIMCYFSNENAQEPRDFSLFNVVDRVFRESDIGNFKESILSGEYGGATEGGDYIVSYSSKGNGFLEIPFHEDRSIRPKFPFEIPEQYQFKSYSRHLVAINNSNVFMVAGKKNTASGELGSRQLIIYNKKEKNWHDLTILGDLAKSRGFGEWIVGYIANTSLEDEILPGSEKWTERKSGLSPMVRFRHYAPGILYFYNAYTKTYFELKTDQADSEVIHIQGNTVIYRVYDKLYTVKIIEGKDLGDSKLLLKDNRVPDMHWAFFGK